jgi:large subunit ribosomal protein L25
MDVTLKAETGRELGTRPSRRLRHEGKVPGTVYGLGKDPLTVAVDWPELRRVLTTEAGLNALITLETDGGTDLTIVKDVQRHPVRRNVLHVDFLRVDPKVEVEVEVPIVLTGTAEALERRGGLVEQALHSLTVRTKPGNIPTQLELDITDVDVGITLTVADLSLPEGVETDLEPDVAVLTGTATRAVLEGEREGEGEGGEGEGGEAGGEGEGGDAEAAGEG